MGKYFNKGYSPWKGRDFRIFARGNPTLYVGKFLIELSSARAYIRDRYLGKFSRARTLERALENPEGKEDAEMLGWAVTFLIIALVAAVLGFGGVAGAAAGIAKILFFVFLVLFLLSLVFGRRVI